MAVAKKKPSADAKRPAAPVASFRKDELANYQTALARMESMVGVDLTSTAAQPGNQHPAGRE